MATHLNGDYGDWCWQHGCDHGHCPDGCEHPQPFMMDNPHPLFVNRILVCGRCYWRFGEVVEMVPCTPRFCQDA